MQNGFYRKIEEMDPNQTNRAMTVLEGAAFGEKALFANGKLIWASRADGFFALHEEEAKSCEGDGIFPIAACRVFCETLAQEKKLVICGGGHVSIPVIRMGIMIGCHVTVLEDRPKFADHARGAGASDVICASFEEGLKEIEGDRDTYFLILTRGHRYDQVCLEQIAGKPHAYIGMIGSRRRTALVKQAAIAHGADPQVIESVYTPVGLAIGAETPEEIAVSIMAQIIAVKHEKKQNGGYPKEILRALCAEEKEGKQESESLCLPAGGAQDLPCRENSSKVLATIVSRKGSAPRSVGTKMLVCPDGECIGSIGGGCAESRVIHEALYRMRKGLTEPGLYRVDMSGEEAEEEGMVCGGVLEVLLETVTGDP